MRRIRQVNAPIYLDEDGSEDAAMDSIRILLEKDGATEDDVINVAFERPQQARFERSRDGTEREVTAVVYAFYWATDD